MAIGATNLILRTVSSASNSATLRVDLNDGNRYLCEYYWVGEPVRDETWIHPDGGYSYLARIQDRPVQMEIVLHVLKSSSVADLQTNIFRVRNEFDNTANFIEVGMGGRLLTISSLTRSGSTVSVTTHWPHGLSTGQPVKIENCAPNAYNTSSLANSTLWRGAPCTVTGPNSFDYTAYSVGPGPTYTLTPVNPGAATRIGWAAGAETYQRFRTYPTAISPAVQADSVNLSVAIGQMRALDWAFYVWRDPHAVGGSDPAATIHNPVV